MAPAARPGKGPPTTSPPAGATRPRPTRGTPSTSLLQPHRTFPALLHLAETVCDEVFGAEGFNATVQAAYAGRSHPLRYVSERQTKR